MDADFCIPSAYVTSGTEWSFESGNSSLKELNRKNMRKNMKFWTLNPYYFLMLTSKLRSKKNTRCWSLQKWSKFKLYSPPYSLIKNFWQIHLRERAMWNLREEIKSVKPCEQNYVAWLVKNSKKVFRKLMQKMSLSVSGEKARRWAST